MDMLGAYNDENREPNAGRAGALQRNLPYQVYKDAEVDGNVIEYEAKKILNKEEELMKKARDLEHEMLQIKQAKVDMVIRQFEAQLMKEADLEEKRHTEGLRDQYEARSGQVEAERTAQTDEIDKMLKQINDQIEFLKVVASELESKKSELSSTS